MSVEGNKNAEKWTEEEALKHVKKIDAYLEENPKCFSITEALVACGGYPEQLIYFSDKFGIGPVFQSIKVIKTKCAARLEQKGYEPYAATMSIFLLKANHGYLDSQEINITRKEDDLSKLTDDELKAMIAIKSKLRED